MCEIKGRVIWDFRPRWNHVMIRNCHLRMRWSHLPHATWWQCVVLCGTNKLYCTYAMYDVTTSRPPSSNKQEWGGSLGLRGGDVDVPAVREERVHVRPLAPVLPRLHLPDRVHGHRGRRSQRRATGRPTGQDTQTLSEKMPGKRTQTLQPFLTQS